MWFGFCPTAPRGYAPASEHRDSDRREATARARRHPVHRILQRFGHRLRTLPGYEGRAVALTPLDRTLIQRCLNHDPGAWNDFVDRYLGLIYHVIHHTAHLRSVPLRPEDVEDLAAEVLLRIVSGDYHVLRQFQ